LEDKKKLTGEKLRCRVTLMGENQAKGGGKMRKICKIGTIFLLLCLAVPCLGPARPAPEALPAGSALCPPAVAITFDDGPRRSTTTALLDGLAERGVHATFFLIGNRLEGSEELVCRMEAEGHQVGIHSTNHKALKGLNRQDFNEEVEGTRRRLEAILGHSDFLLRPPYGMVDQGVKTMAGSPIILWSIDPEDWDDKNVQREVAEVTSAVQDGDIILFHDIYPESVTAALAVIDKLMAEGYYFVTVEELFSMRGMELKAGEVYLHARDQP